MKKFFVVVVMLLPFVGMAQELKLDTENASVSFLFVSENVEGKLGGIDATLKLNLSDLGSSIVKGTADVSTIATGSKVRDKHLKSKDFFHAEQYPKMSFSSKSLVKKGDAYFAKGALTIKDVTKEMTFKMILKGDVLVMTATLNADDFGVSPKKADKSNVEVTISVPLEK